MHRSTAFGVGKEEKEQGSNTTSVWRENSASSRDTGSDQGAKERERKERNHIGFMRACGKFDGVREWRKGGGGGERERRGGEDPTKTTHIGRTHYDRPNEQCDG